jgi:hypothetical protein
VIALVCFRFFLAGACCLSWAASFIVWGLLFGYYLNIISETALDEDVLPEVDVGTSITFLWHVLEPIFLFSYTLFLVELPFLITLAACGPRHHCRPGLVQPHLCTCCCSSSSSPACFSSPPRS